MVIIVLVTAITFMTKLLFSDQLAFVTLITAELAMFVFEREGRLVMVVNMFFPLRGLVAHLTFLTIIAVMEIVDLMTRVTVERGFLPALGWVTASANDFDVFVF